MPTVKVTAGTGTRGADLSAGLEPLKSVTEDIKTRRTLDYATKMADYKTEEQRIKTIEDQYNLDYKTALDQIMEAEKAKGGSFDSNTATKLREMAREVANANATSSLGDKYGYSLTKEDAYNVIAKNNRALDAMVNNAGPLAALASTFESSARLKNGEIGKVVFDKDGNVGDLMEVVIGVKNNDPSVSYDVDEAGNSYYVKGNIKIPIEAINQIMTGENADYPFTVNADPTDTLKVVHEGIPATAYSRAVSESYQKRDGEILTTIANKKVVVDLDRYKELVSQRLDGVIKDPGQMEKFWNVITEGQGGYYDPANDTEEGRSKLTDWAVRNFLPTETEVITEESEKSVESILKTTDKDTGTGDGDEEIGYNKWLTRTNNNLKTIAQNANTKSTDAIERQLETQLGKDLSVKIDNDDPNKLIIRGKKIVFDEKAYSRQQAAVFNKAAGTEIIDKDGYPIDENTLETLIEEGTIPKQKAKGREVSRIQDQRIINDWRSPSGINDLIMLMMPSEYAKGKTRNLVADQLAELTAEEQRSFTEDKSQKARKSSRSANIIKLKDDAREVSNNQSLVGFLDVDGTANPPWLKQGIKFFKNLPPDFVIKEETNAYGDVKKILAKDYFDKYGVGPDGKSNLKKGDFMYDYARVYEKVVNNPSLAPKVDFSYVSLTSDKGVKTEYLTTDIDLND